MRGVSISVLLLSRVSETGMEGITQGSVSRIEGGTRWSVFLHLSPSRPRFA
jgi:hypothetical protein